MPPSKNTRDIKTPTQKQTLHQFFKAPSAARIPINPAAKSRHSKSTAAKSSLPSNNKQEIIFIDSDSDEDVVEFVESSKTIKKRKLSLNNALNNTPSVLPFTDIKPACSNGSSSQAKENVIFITGTETVVDSDPQFTATMSQSSSFGSPLLLIPPTTRPAVIEKKETPLFGVPLLFDCLGTQKIESLEQGVSSLTSARSNFVLLPEDSSSIPDPMLDEWEDGDDEDVVEFVIEDTSDFQESYPSLSRRQSSTTIADKYEDSYLHVNNSLDDLCLPAKPNANATASSSKVLPEDSNHTLPTFGPQELISCDGKKPKRTTGNNAFSVLMTSFKENEVWKEATVAEHTDRQKFKGNRRKAPFYKVLQGMPIAVDAFRYGAIPGVTAYFLTHAHSDHYTNLSSNWKHGPIYCSEGTGNLIIHMLSVDRKWVHPLPMDTPTVIPNTNGVTVTLIEANHCPGSCLFFYEGRQTVNAGDSTYKSSFVGTPKVFRYLHCGDFRASPRHILHPAVKDKVIDHVYLDSTYLDPKYTFPPQPLVISACAELAKRLIESQTTNSGPKSTMFQWIASSEPKGKDKEKSKPLIVVGTYSIGKERIVKAIAHALNSKVYCDPRKAAILRCEGDSDLNSMLTSNPREAMIHLVPLGTITSDHLNTYLSRYKGIYTNIIGFRPTGWTFVPAAGSNTLPAITSILEKGVSLKDFKHTDLKPSGKSTSTLQVYPVPYSEHSSFYELTCFAMSFNWVKMIATVNVGSESSRGKMKRWVDRWEAERNKRIKDTIVPYRHPDYW